MTPPDLLATLGAAAEDIAHARRAIAAAGRTEDPAARRALSREAAMAVVNAADHAQVAGRRLLDLALAARVPR